MLSSGTLMLRSTRRRYVCALLLISGAWITPGCLAPTLPLPPPSQPDVEGPTAEGRYMLSGNVQDSSALVQALNPRLRKTWGQISDDSGAYRFEIEAQVGDEIRLWYEVAGERSGTAIVTIRR